MNKLFVALTRRLSFFWQRMGADPRALALILSAKLKMDDRGGYVMGQRQASGSGFEGLIFGVMFLLGGGSATLFLFLPGSDAIAVIFAFWIIYIGLLLVTELSDQILDTRDVDLLLSRPITATTLSLSRMLHIGVFVAKFGLALGFPVFAFLLFWKGVWGAIVFFLLSLVVGMLIVSSTLGLYVSLLKYMDASRVRKWVGYLQITLTTIFFILYQLPNIFANSEAVENLEFPTIVGEPLGFFFPSFWVGGLWATLTSTGYNSMVLMQAGLALVALVLGWWFYIHQSRDYGDDLLQLKRTSSNTAEDVSTESSSASSGFVFSPRSWLGRRLTSPGLERASFNFHWRMMSRDLDYKQRTYPSIVLFPVLALGLIGNFGSGEGESAANLGADQAALLILLYMLVITVIQPLVSTKVSKDYQASWVFMAHGSEDSRPLRYGQFMAVNAMFLFPMALIVYSITVFFWGVEIIPDTLLSLAVTLLIGYMVTEADTSLPFSLTKDGGMGKSFGPMILAFILTPVFGFGHYFLSWFPYVIPVAALIAWGILTGLWWDMKRQQRRS